MATRKRPILKKRTTQEQKEDLESLLVFGYECKLFKDDEKAEYIEHGNHLIPWMGDNTVMIDRYDGRGYLHDLRPYDADLNCHKNTELNGEEQAVEAACDEERYLELNTDYMERVLYEEEELKRLHEALGDDSYGAVGFSYDKGEGQQDYQADNSDSEKDEAFVPPPELHVPEGIRLPDSVKMNAIVMKTAKCISEHGMQMEIIIKTKQKDNPQFDFLECDSELYPYYRHLVQMIKSGRYKPSLILKPRRSRQESITDEDEYYLHPSLLKTSSSSGLTTQDILSIISSRLPMSQISDTPYARLVEKMKQSGCRSPLNSTVSKSDTAPVEDGTPLAEDGTPPLTPPPMPPFVVIADSESQRGHRRLPPVPGVEPVILPPRIHPPPETVHAPHRDMDEDDDRPQTEPPPPDIQPIIDKMAMYVAKNGPEFEIVVKSKKDKRFDFLHSWHKHFPYYHHKKTLHLQELKGDASSTDDDDDSGSVGQGQLKSISFSIRNKELDGVSLGGRGALLGYDSSEEDSSGEKDQDGDSGHGGTEGTVVIPQDITATKDRTPQSTEELEKKLVEQKLRDKLAAAARDKLAHTAKEKQLQAERKRKAAMFISMLKGGAAAAQSNSESQAAGSSLPTSASAPTMSLEGSHSSSRNDAGPSGSPPNRRRSPDLYSRFPRHSRSPVNHHRSRHKRHWSPARRRSRSPLKRPRGKTPPSAYSVVRRSLSKSPRRRRKSRSHSPHQTKRPRPTSPTTDKAHPRQSSPSVSKFKSKGKKRSRSRSKSKKRSRSNSKSRQRSTSRRRSRSKSKGHSTSKAKEVSLSKVSPPRGKSQKQRSRSRSHSKSKRSRKSQSRSKKHKRSGSSSPSRRKRSHSRSPSRHKVKKHSKSKKKAHSPSKHKSKSKSKKSPSKSKRSRSRSRSRSKSKKRLSRSRSRSKSKRLRSRTRSQSKSKRSSQSRSRSASKKRSPSQFAALSPSRCLSKQPLRSRLDDVIDSESKRSPSVSKTLPLDAVWHLDDEGQDLKKAIFENDPVKSLADSPSTDDNSPTKKHKEALPQEATDGDASNDSDVIIIGEETAPLREFGATPRGVDSPSGAGKPVSEDLLMKVRAMLKASRQEIDMT